MTAPSTHRWSRACGATAIGVFSVISLAACGSQSSAAPVPTSGSASTSAAASSSASPKHAARAAYQQCLEKNGVTMPSKHRGEAGEKPEGAPPSGGAQPSGAAPSGGAQPSGAPGMKRHRSGPPPGVSEATWTKAQQACASLKPTMSSSEAPAG